MIPRSQVKQDLVLSRALVELYGNLSVVHTVAFRGGTALHKLFFDRHGRYSEDIDLVQIDTGAIGPILKAIRTSLDPWLGEPKWKQSQGRVTMIYRFETTSKPIQLMRLKVEINTREHFVVFGIQRHPFVVDSPWFSGNADISTYRIEELQRDEAARSLSEKEGARPLQPLARSYIA